MLNLEISIVIYRTKINKIEKNLSYLRKGISASLNYFINIFSIMEVQTSFLPKNDVWLSFYLDVRITVYMDL